MTKDMEKITQLVVEALRAKGVTLEGSKECKNNREKLTVPVGISNRHIHLSQEDLETCFGKGYQLTPIKDLSQPGQYACKETMTIVGPKGAIEKVRVLGPVRSSSQVEILASDNFKLGTEAPLRISGDITGSAPITIVGSKGSVYLKEGAIVAKRHIHMNPDQARRYGVENGEIVAIKVEGMRGGLYHDVVIRASDSCYLDCHIDTEEANAMGIGPKTVVTIVKYKDGGER